jgi:hypothetical protein
MAITRTPTVIIGIAHGVRVTMVTGVMAGVIMGTGVRAMVIRGTVIEDMGRIADNDS